MNEYLNDLNEEYKQKKKEATSREEKQQIKHDYKEVKGLIKGADKLLKKDKTVSLFCPLKPFHLHLNSLQGLNVYILHLLEN